MNLSEILIGNYSKEAKINSSLAISYISFDCKKEEIDSILEDGVFDNMLIYIKNPPMWEVSTINNILSTLG